ncbi:thiamine-phosphate synthase [Methanobacterium alkalithermotolerans]|uniref:Thiamine-phosphate synthase n=1 Tax=Methanobacterium alkalithermotolerans TaxID=2731220 RepID=A0A8T8K7H0_9EURY|nr:thiamine-phosphate synthase family protein [Methanobacterium alkalithermotolerans]QUH22920.1 thiamine-phosphate synthase [Methanobacterium alkalithermotolerans]
MELENLKKAIKILKDSEDFAQLVPEVRTNLVMARKNAKKIEDVAGFPGRITTAHNKVIVCMDPEFGASSHMARMVLNILKYDSQKRSAINLRYDPLVIKICKKLGLLVSSYDRNQEPEDISIIEGGTIPWGVKESIKKLGQVPDVIYHKGAWGKEPIICLLAPDAVEAARTADCIARLYKTINI